MLWIAAGTLTVLALLCTAVPLLDHPGYEFAFIIAVAGTVVTGFLTINRAVPRYRVPEGTAAGGMAPFPVVRVYLASLGINLLLLLLPFGVILLNGFFVPLCDVREGVVFYLLLPVAGVVFSTALALFCTVHYRRSRMMFLFFAGLTYAYALWLGYATPAVYSYNLFYGFFPGLTYDELLPLELPLVLFRVVTLAAAAVLVWLTALIVARSAPEDGAVRKGVTLLQTLWRDHRHVSLAIAALGVLLYLFRCEIGWESTASFIRSRLGGEKSTAHFTIHYDAASLTPAAVERLAAEHEFRLAQIQEEFVLPHVERITSYVYPSAEAKRRAIGAGRTELAKPWSREVHITVQNVDAVLKHELVHVVAAPFGVPVLRASLSPGLVEGLAIAIEGTWGGRTLDEHAALLRRAGLMPPMERMLGATGFIAQGSSVSYVLAGAFVRHLIDRYGMRRLLLVYGNPSWEEVYGRPLPELIEAWHRAVDSVAVEPADTAVVDVLFRRPPLIGSVCVRLHARRIREAQRLMEERRYDEALPLVRVLAAEGGYDAVAGLASLRMRRQEFAAALDLYDSLLAHDPRPGRYLPMAITAGDAAWALGNPVRARMLYGTVRSARVTPGLTERAAIRLQALADTATASGFRTWFLADVSDTVRAAMLNAPTGTGADSLRWYLRGRALERLDRFADARQLYERAAFRGADPVLEAARLIALGDAALRSGGLQEARVAYWLALNHVSGEAAVRQIEDRIARCEFLERYP